MDQPPPGALQIPENHALLVKKGTQATFAHSSLSNRSYMATLNTQNREIQSYHMTRRRTRNVQWAILMTATVHLLPASIHSQPFIHFRILF